MKLKREKLVDLTERDEKYISKDELSFINEEKVESALASFEELVRITPDLSGQGYHFRAESKVGVIVNHGLRVQVHPKLAAGEFCTMLRYALSGRISATHLRASSDYSWAYGFENALGMMLRDEVNEITRIGLSRRYEERIELLDLLRGRVLWERNFPWRAGKSGQIACRYKRLTYDNLDNRILLGGLRRAVGLVDHRDAKAGLIEHCRLFSDFALETDLDISQVESAEHRYNRLNEHYRVAHILARMFLFSLRPRSFFQIGSHPIPGVIFDMAWLFEKFIERYVSDIFSRVGVTVDAQSSDYLAILDGEGRSYASVRPDLEVWSSGKLLGIIDAKYKAYWQGKEEGEKPERKISNEDLYQMFFYQLRMQKRHNLQTPPLTVIAAPMPADDERGNAPTLAERFKKIVFQAGAEKAGEIRLFLVPMTDILRRLSKGVDPVDSSHRSSLLRCFLAEERC
jgi:5-methylcytosine-specific restriction enzyme subunit McrC